MKKCKTISISLMLVLLIFLTGCNSIIAPQKNTSNNKSLTSMQVNSYIKKNNVGNVVSINDIGNKYTNILVQNNSSEFTCYTLSSIYGKIIKPSEYTESSKPLPDVNTVYSTSEPYFILIIINNASIASNGDKLIVTYLDTKNSEIREIIEPMKHRKYITLSYNNLNELINNIRDIEIFDKDGIKLYGSKNNIND